MEEAPWQDKVFEVIDEYMNWKCANWYFHPNNIPEGMARVHSDVEFSTSDDDSDFSESSGASYARLSDDEEKKKTEEPVSPIQTQSPKLNKAKTKITKKAPPTKVTAFSGALELQNYCIDKIKKREHLMLHNEFERMCIERKDGYKRRDTAVVNFLSLKKKRIPKNADYEKYHSRIADIPLFTRQ